MPRRFQLRKKDKESNGLPNGVEPDGESHDSADSADPPPPKVSIRQLFRYATACDLLLIVVGSAVAVVTGLGFPFMSIIMGDISQSFVNITTFLDSCDKTTTASLAVGSTETSPLIVSICNEYSRGKFSDEVIRDCLRYVYLGCGILTAAFIQVFCYLTASENMINRMRREFFRAILRQDIAWFDKNHTGTLAPKLFDNLERVREGTGDKVALLIQFVSQFFGGFIVAFTYDWRLTLIMMSLSPFMMICGAFIAKLMATSATREAEKYAAAGAIAEEVLTSIRTVAAFDGLEHECNRYDEALRAGKADGIRKSLYIGIGLGLTFLIIFASYCLAFWVGTEFVYKDKMKAGTVLTVFFSVMMGSMALGQAGPQFAVVGTAQGAAGHILQIIDRVPEIDSYSEQGRRLKKPRGHVKVTDVRFAYPTRKDIEVLKGISFEASPGETVALVGSSGCGKSTIVQLLLRYYNPASGTITIDDVEVRDLNIEYLRQLIAVVSQEPILFNTTIEENIKYGRADITEGEILAALRKANAYNFVMSFPEGIHTLVGDRGTQMSGGQKQRIAIARALVRDPRILLLDEATSALDAESESVVQEALEKASEGRTTIVIAHRLSTIRNANKIIAMKNGEVVEVGTHDELLARKGLYHELVNAQVFADVEDAAGEKRGYARHISRDSQRVRSASASSAKKRKSIADGPMTEEEKKKSELERLKKELAEEGGEESNLIKILKYARPEWIYIIIATIASIIQGCVFPAFSLFFSQIYQVFAKKETDPHGMRREGHLVSLLFLGLGILQATTMLLQAFFYGIAAERLTMRLRSRVFRQVMRQDMSFFDMPSHSSGKISTRLATDAPNVKSAIDYRFGSVFSAVVGVTCGIGIAFYYGWQMALLVIAIFPLGGVGQAIQIKYIQGRSNQDAKEMENSGKIAMEAIENIRTVQALTLEKRLHAKFSHHLDHPHATSRRKALLQSISYAFATSIFFFLYASAFRFGLWLIMHGHMQPLHVLKVLYAIGFTAGSLGFASSYFPEYMKAKFAAGLIFKMLEMEPKIDGLSSRGKKPSIEGHVSFSNLFFNYPQRPTVQILKGLDIEVHPGETLALVGPSGCGKSTVVSLLERFYDPLDGAVKVDSTDLREINIRHMRSQIALVSQEPILFDTSIKDNILYGLPKGSISDAQVVAATQKANIHKFIEGLPEGYATRVGEKGTQLSGGQKQRIAIARALIRNPKILLLDEATSALDTESEKLVQEALDAASEGRTCIVIAHRLSTIINANCIAVVKNGVVIEKGTHTELMQRRGAYFELTQRQATKVTTNF